MPLVLGVQVSQGVISAREAEQRFQEGEGPLKAWIELVDTLTQLLLYLQRVVPLLNLKVHAQNL